MLIGPIGHYYFVCARLDYFFSDCYNTIIGVKHGVGGPMFIRWFRNTSLIEVIFSFDNGHLTRDVTIGVWGNDCCFRTKDECIEIMDGLCFSKWLTIQSEEQSVIRHPIGANMVGLGKIQPKYHLLRQLIGAEKWECKLNSSYFKCHVTLSFVWNNSAICSFYCDMTRKKFCFVLRVDSVVAIKRDNTSASTRIP